MDTLVDIGKLLLMVAVLVLSVGIQIVLANWYYRVEQVGELTTEEGDEMGQVEVR